MKMVAAVSGPAAPSNSNPKPSNSRQDHDLACKRPPLLPSEKDNSFSNTINNPKRLSKSKNVSSRYLSPSPSTSTSNSSSISSSSSTSRRFPSPLVSRNSTSMLNTPKRSVSADRKRPVFSRPLTPDLNTNEVSSATKMLITCTRSLSVSFQGESFSLPISKTKVTPVSPSLRKSTPERKRTSTPLRGDGSGSHIENSNSNSKPIDQHRWPARIRQPNPLSRSIDFNTRDRNKVIGSSSMIKTLQQSIIEEKRSSFEGRLSLEDVNNESSDTDSVSSGSTNSGSRKGIVGPAKFWQETNTRLRRFHDPGSKSPISKLTMLPKMKKNPGESIFSSPSPIRKMSTSSPSRVGPTTPSTRGMSSSPSRVGPTRGISSSPSRVRNAVSTINNNFNDSPSVLSFAVDIRRGKIGENKIFDAHLLRLLYNRHLQWRLVNARTEATLQIQKRSVEKNLWNAWITISDLRDTVTKKRHRLQLLRQKLKLASILKGQIRYLEDWACLDKDHCISLMGAIEALKASTLRLPVGGSIAEIQSLKEAVKSAADVMQAMSYSIRLFLPKVDEVNSLVLELAKVIVKERALLRQCKELLSVLAAIEVKDCSLRTHIIQYNRVRTI